MSDHVCADCTAPATVLHRNGSVNGPKGWTPITVWLCTDCANCWDRLYDEEIR